MTIRRARWRISALLSALVIATGILVQAAPTMAVGTGTMEWTGSRWEDSACDSGSELFDVRFWRDSNYSGTQWRTCTHHSNFCMSPYGVDSPSAALCLNAGYDGETMNDYPSSVKVVAVNGGTSCRVQIRVHANYGGSGLTEWDPINYPSLAPGFADAFSSIRRTC
jgi:hypothetical protein